MIDRIIEVGDRMTTTSFTVLGDNVFCENGFLREPGLIENMAQTAAAGVGMKPGNISKEPPLGFIGGIRNLRIHHLPRVGQLIKTTIRVEHEILDATVAQGSIFLDGQLMAECELKIFLIANP